MKKLVSSSEAASILGLSLQGIHYRIKKGQLESIKKDGKTFVYIDENTTISNTTKPTTPKPTKNTPTKVTPKQQIDQNNIINQFALKSKDEQISLLKKTIKLIKKQYIAEISRLETNHQKALNVFQSEVELLKSAFNEMQQIYKNQNKLILEHSLSTNKPNNTTVTTTATQTKQKPNLEKILKIYKKIHNKYLTIQEFYSIMKKHNKTDKEIKTLILQRVMKKDKRFYYDNKTKRLIILNSNFSDII